MDLLKTEDSSVDLIFNTVGRGVLEETGRSTLSDLILSDKRSYVIDYFVNVIKSI